MVCGGMRRPAAACGGMRRHAGGAGACPLAQDTFCGFDTKPARPNWPKSDQNGRPRVRPTACHASPIRHKAARTRTEDPPAWSGAGWDGVLARPARGFFLGGGGAPQVRDPPRGPAEAVCRGVWVLKKSCVGQQTRSLACGLARWQKKLPQYCREALVVVACVSNLLGEGGSNCCYR